MPEEASWLRRLSGSAGVEPDAMKNSGSHSLKATALSWAAKAAVAKSHRRLLGGHVKLGGRSMLEYTRDELDQPLRHQAQVLS